MESKVVTAHVPLELAAKVDAIAARRDRSRGWIMKQALTEWVTQEERRYQLTLEALADVDAGKAVDHEEVEKWAESLDTDEPVSLPSCG
jgi:predicted transcriptional regulator